MITNLYKQFLELLPARPLQVGEVLVIDDQMATIELPGGGLLQARANGTANVGDNVYVRDGAIEGEAPNLPIEIIEI